MLALRMECFDIRNADRSRFVSALDCNDDGVVLMLDRQNNVELPLLARKLVR